VVNLYEQNTEQTTIDKHLTTDILNGACDSLQNKCYSQAKDIGYSLFVGYSKSDFEKEGKAQITALVYFDRVLFQTREKEFQIRHLISKNVEYKGFVIPIELVNGTPHLGRN